MLFFIIKTPQKEILYLAFPKQTTLRLSNLPADRSHSFLHASLMADNHFKYHTYQKLVSLNNSQTRNYIHIKLEKSETMIPKLSGL